MTPQRRDLRATLALFFAAEIRGWRGEMPLWIVFWGYGVVLSLVLATVFVTAFSLGETALLQGLVVLSALYSFWIVVGIWRCSQNAAPLWGNLARWLTVAWALNSGFVLLFLQFDLLVKYLQG